MQKHIALLGGTFDPVHNGHLQIAQLVLERLKFDQVIFIPNKTPPHRAIPQASANQRQAMLELATASNNKFIISHSELERAGPSYMVDTLDSISQQHPHCLPWLILGADAFELLPTWHNFEKLITSCNFIVLNRNLSPQTPTTWAENYLKNNTITLDELNILTNTYKYKPNGAVIFLDNKLIDISGTQIRALIRKYYTEHLEKDIILTKLQSFLPKQVINYILEHELYIR